MAGELPKITSSGGSSATGANTVGSEVTTHPMVMSPRGRFLATTFEYQQSHCRTWLPSPEQKQHPISNRSEEHTSELQSQSNLVCRLLLEKTNKPAPASERRPHLLLGNTCVVRDFDRRAIQLHVRLRGMSFRPVILRVTSDSFCAGHSVSS